MYHFTLMRGAIALIAASATLAILSTAEAQNPAAEADAFFKKHQIVVLNVEIGPKDMDALRREPRKYVKATLREGDKIATKIYKDVGVHLKGAAGSFRGVDDKPGLTINMDKFDGQFLFYGMDKFHLANCVQDPSYISEMLCGEIFRTSGVPASRGSHAVVSINGQRKGLYFLKEGYDGSFLRRHFKSKAGYFYDGGFLRDIDQPLQVVSGKEERPPHQDLKALLSACREGDRDERFKKMEKVLDMDKFITYLALEVILWDWDGYPMNRNNYRIYHDEPTDKLIFIPSGMDQMLHDPNGPLFPGIQGEVARNLLETPQGKQRYMTRVEELLKTTANPAKVSKRLDELQAKVMPALAFVDVNAARDYPNQVNRLRQGLAQRAKKLDEELRRHTKKK